MKNNKGIMGVLFVAVLVIWGLIFYKLYTSFFSESMSVASLNSAQRKEVKLDEEKVFSISADYRDPFFGKMMYNPANVEGVSKKTPIVKKAEMDWSFIKYFGIIKNKNSKKGIALITIQEKENMVVEGDEVEGVKLLKVFKDSVRVSYKGKTTYIKKN